MKKITLKGVFSLALLAACFSGFAQEAKQNVPIQTHFELTEATKQNIEQTGFARCLSVENEAILQQNKRRYTDDQFEEWLAPRIAEIKANRAAGKAQMAVYNIPVVIHIIHNGDPVNTPGNATSENISDAQAISQINVMNQDYRKMIGTPGDGPGVDVEINFCLAQQDANGNPTSGIVRHNITPYSNTTTVGVVDDWETRADVETMKTTTQWDPTKYINFWSIKPGGASLNAGGLTGLLGYAQFPDPAATGVTGIGPGDVGPVGAANTDGVVAGYDAFGTIAENDGSFLMNGTYNLGRTMTHEVGHWLGLRHVWGDGNCSVDDFCADTPNSGAPNYSCVTNDSCTGAANPGNDPIENYMDYTNDACMDRFTQDQKDRMQAIMAGSPRRMELNSSIGCQAAAPYISYELETLTQNETTDCNFTDITVNVEIAAIPSQPADITITKTGSAIDNVDYEVIGGNLTFPTSGMANQLFTLRIFNDGFVESTETVTLGMTLNANGGDALITTAADREMIITINDNDIARSVTQETIDFVDDFNDQDISDWALTDVDGDGRNWGDQFQVTNAGGNPVSTVSMISRSWISGVGPINPHNWAVSPAIDLSGSAGAVSVELSWKVACAAASWDQEQYTVYAATSNDITTLQASPVNFNETYNDPADTGSIYTRTLDLSSLAGNSSVYVAFRHHDSTDEDWIGIDDVTVTTVKNAEVQQVVNTANQILLASTGTIYSSDNGTGDVMLDITNNNGVDYGCVSTNVSRASGPAVMYGGATATADFVMGKTYAITPTSVQAGGNATLKFYFTQAEIDQWVTDTGNAQADLRIIKDNGATQEVLATTAGTFGSHVTLEGTSSTGINATYYFGRQESLSVGINNFTTFNVYPVPTKGNINVVVATDQNVVTKVFDVRGRLVYNEVHANSNAVFTKEINIAELSSGVYMLTVESGNKKATQKIVIE